MTTPDSRTPHAEEPSEGAERPGEDVEGRTPHPDEPAEGTEDAARSGDPG